MAEIIEYFQEEENDNELIYSENPFVATYSNILTDDECEHFIAISKDNLKRALVSDNEKGYVSQGRTGSNTWLEHDHDEIVSKVGERIAKIVNMPYENAEKFQVIYYGKNEEYKQHFDSWLHDGSTKTQRCMKWGGARMKTALCYLNDVPKGGGTKMTKLDITINPEKGKLLVFHNTLSEIDHTRHELSEHAGLPVEEGEKFAFNLWFKECNSKVLYEDFNPSYYKTMNDILTEKKEPSITIPSINDFSLGIDKEFQLSSNKEIFRLNSFCDNFSIQTMINNCNFNTRERRDAWVNLVKIPEFIQKLEYITHINSSFYENVNIVEYKQGKLHSGHLNAYDLNSESGKKYTSKLGQRLVTISVALSDNLVINFSNLNLKLDLQQGDVLIYKNILKQSLERDKDLEKSIICNKNTGYLANIYIRCKNKNNENFLEIDVKKENHENNINFEIIEQEQEQENYNETLNEVFNKFSQDEITTSWKGYKSFKYNFKGNFNSFKDYIKLYNLIREKKQCLNPSNLELDYVLNSELPLQIVNNVIDKELLSLLQNYYKDTISTNTWLLGDRQSNRYKAHNEPMSRFLHYEILPLIEKIVGKPMKPTYTYLSAYIKGSDLPPHTDRPDCEYTVSFVVDKPEGCNWNIYVHKPQQAEKYKGRYDFRPSLDECEAVDCEAGGLMMFQGTDHIHFREKLEFDYYNILLLHYCSV